MNNTTENEETAPSPGTTKAAPKRKAKVANKPVKEKTLMERQNDFLDNQKDN